MNNMKRVIWVGVTLLIMIAIMGFGLHTLNHISDVNQQRREKEEGEALASQFIGTEVPTTNVWQAIRQEQEITVEAMTDENGQVMTDENGNVMTVPPEESTSVAADPVEISTDEDIPEEMPVETDTLVPPTPAEDMQPETTAPAANTPITIVVP